MPMSSVFSAIGLISRRDSPEILDSVLAVYERLTGNGCAVVVDGTSWPVDRAATSAS